MKFKILLVLLITFFLSTRLYKITEVPGSLYWDEASIGYNAYSISQNLKDEWGDSVPLHFRAFGEFKLPVYIYSVAVATKIFGYNEFSVRIPAVLYSLFSIIVAGLMAYKIFKDQWLSLFIGFLLTISPWFFIFSRTGYEATAGLFFYLAGILVLLYSKDKKLLLLAAALSFIVSMYSYNSYRILSLTTFPIVFLLTREKKEIRKDILIFGVSFVLIFISLVPVIRLILYDAGFSRAETFSLFPHIQQVYDINGNPRFQIIYDRFNVPNWSKNLLQVFGNFFSHLSPSFLLTGDINPRSQIPGFGQIYFLDLVFGFFGLIYLAKAKNKRSLILISFLLLGSLIPPSLFKESPHALRSLTGFVFITILVGYGFENILKKQKIKNLLYLLFVTLYLFLFSKYYLNFLDHYFGKYSKEWQYSYKVVFSDYKDLINSSNKVIVSDNFGQPYIFALYYLKTNPDEFLNSRTLSTVDRWGFSTVAGFGKFEFREPVLEDVDSGALVFSSEKLKGLKELNLIKELNGEETFWVYKK